jgi:hypothetical protein
MQFDLSYQPPFFEVGSYLLVVLFAGSLIGAVWALLTSVRGRATPSLRKAWLSGFAAGAYVGGMVLGLDIIGIEPDFHVLLFSVWLAVAALLAGLVLFLRGETATRDLGRLTYQCVSLAGLGFFVFMMTALASSSAFH